MSRVTFEGKRYPLMDGESVLDALIRGGSSVQHSCRKGTCHICMLKAVDTLVDPAAQKGLPKQAAKSGYFLPCQCYPAEDFNAMRPDRAELFVGATISEKTLVAPRIARLLLEPDTNLRARPGQFISIRHPTGACRSYSLVSIPEEDYFLEIHVKRIDGGVVSTWLVDQLVAGDRLELSGPTGACTYEVSDPDTPLLFIGTGTGIGPMAGVARDALKRGHRGSMRIYHGVRRAEDLYLHDRLQTLADESAGQLAYYECVSGKEEVHTQTGRAVDLAFDTPLDQSTVVFLAGAPAPVAAARVFCVRQGLPRRNVFADSFDFAHPDPPRDKEKLRALKPDPELWNALEDGQRLRRILSDFYSRVYEDPRLAPFFHRITKKRAIDKQYEFTVDLFTGSKHYFGLGPYNAHHWMVISDELFDYREQLLEECIRREGLEEHLIARWLAIDESFRREIVKTAPRGLYVDGKERPPPSWEEETLAVGTICDGCASAMDPGDKGRINGKTGEMFCLACAARRVGETLPPTRLSVPAQ